MLEQPTMYIMKADKSHPIFPKTHLNFYNLLSKVNNFQMSFFQTYLHFMFVGMTNDSSEIDPIRLRTVIAMMNTFKLDLNFLCLLNTTNKAMLKNKLNTSNIIQYMAIIFCK